MRIAIISDIHGNYPALVNVVEDALTNNVDKFVFAGDYIFDLPYSNEVARYLMKLHNAYIIKGNKEVYLQWLKNDDQANWTYNQMGAVYQTFRELTPETFDFLDGLKEELYIPEISLYAIHFLKTVRISQKFNCNSYKYHKKMYTKEQYSVEFNECINSDEIKSQIDQIDAKIIVFGHNHLQSYGYCGDKLIINPGSCGQPLDFNTAAPYTIVDTDDYSVTEKRVTYDIESVIEYAKNSAMYEKGKIWVDLVFLALKTGKDYFGILFEIAHQIKLSKNETGVFFSNETWAEANEIFNSSRQNRQV
ncbi:MAG: metallophosphoesterase family protein [Oscillospiraceae bacterium]|nr:metallophosphoesterase family protein [Oscillospiraceae bacterium]